VVPENRPGAAGINAAAAVAHARADGYTLILIDSGTVVNPMLRSDARYKMSDFTMVGMVGTRANATRRRCARGQPKLRVTERFDVDLIGLVTAPRCIIPTTQNLLHSRTDRSIQIEAYKAGLGIAQAKTKKITTTTGKEKNSLQEQESEPAQSQATRMQKPIRSRDEFDALRLAMPDLDRLGRYERRALAADLVRRQVAVIFASARGFLQARSYARGRLNKGQIISEGTGRIVECYQRQPRKARFHA
jgi:hypothetical protein